MSVAFNEKFERNGEDQGKQAGEEYPPKDEERFAYTGAKRRSTAKHGVLPRNYFH